MVSVSAITTIDSEFKNLTQVVSIIIRVFRVVIITQDVEKKISNIVRCVTVMIFNFSN